MKSCGELSKIDEKFEAITEGEEADAQRRSSRRSGPRSKRWSGNPKRINLVAADLVQHYERRLEAMEGNAMIV